jgi:hypothetical protein
MSVTDVDNEILFIDARDPNVVHPPTELQGEPWQSRFIFNPNQPPPPVLATRFFPPPPWPENLEGENLTIEPVVGPFLSLSEEQMETPPGFGRFPPGFEIEGAFFPFYGRSDRRRDRREDRGERREDRRDERLEGLDDRRDERQDRREDRDIGLDEPPRRRRGRPRREPLEGGIGGGPGE